jgi:hypothetical protein
MKNGLWLVTPEQNIQEGNALYIVASTLKAAVGKAERWLKRNRYNQRLKKVEFQGTVDAL